MHGRAAIDRLGWIIRVRPAFTGDFVAEASMRMKRPQPSFLSSVLSALMACAVLALAGCGGAADGNQKPTGLTYPYKITTTVGMISDIVRQVAGDKAVVTGIIGEGVDPHLFRPSTSDTRKLMSADLVFYNGLLLEGKMSDRLISVASSGKPVFAVTELVEEKYLLQPKEFAGHFDPHVWMDVQAWMKAVEAVAAKLAAFDSANAGYYCGNADAYLVELTKLQRYARQTIATIPRQQRVMITAHDAFNYFARAYDIEVQGIQGLSTESEAGLERINSLVDMLVDRQIRAVFHESSVPRKNIDALKEGAADRGHIVGAGGMLFSDAMGAAGTYEGTYIGMIDHNVTTVARALGGTAPLHGMGGKLTGYGHE